MFWNQPLIAIDIGSSSVKICELKNGGKSLKQIGLETFQQAAVEDGDIKDAEVVRNTILKMLKKLNINTHNRRTSISLSGSGVWIKKLNIIPEKGGDIIEQAAYEATQLLPQDPDDLYLRYVPIGKPPNEGPVPVVAVGARRELVESHISLINSVGLKTGVVDCAALSLANMFDYNFPVSGAMIVLTNIGASSTQVIVIYNGQFLYTREVPIGGRDYNLAIADAMGVDEENAENLKISASLGDVSVSENLSEVMNQVNEHIATEIQTTINFFFENEEYPEGLSRKGYVFLVGGAAKSIGLDATLAATLQMPVQVANPFQRIDTKGSPYKPEYMLTHGSLYGVSMGLALRKFGDH